MAEYIDINQLWKCETCFHNGQNGCSVGLGCDHGESYRPAHSKFEIADVAPVVHASWEHFEQGYFDLWRCSACGDEWTFEYDPTDADTKVNYCPNCGARMDGDGNG